MLKKRLIGVITVKDGWAVQSFGYRRYLPLGHATHLAENLDRWGVDEILVVSIDRSRGGLGPDLALVARLGKLGLSTPLTYGGGIRHARDAGAVVELGAERICVDAALRAAPDEIRKIAALVGAQAVIGAFPLRVRDGFVEWFDYQTRGPVPVMPEVASLFTDGVVSEALVIDCEHEGAPNSFDPAIVDRCLIPDVPLIVFGGVSEAAQVAALLERPRVVAIGVGNFLSYTEHAVQRLKEQLTALPLRPPSYARA